MVSVVVSPGVFTLALLATRFKLDTRLREVDIWLGMSSERPEVFERRFQNQLPELSRVTQEALRFLEQSGLSDRAIYRANLAIEELATNTLKYGYGDGGIHDILLRIQVQPGAVLLVLEDDGRPFNPLEAPAPDLSGPAEERAVGGLGIHLVRQLVEQMTYERCEGRNRLTVRVRG